MELTVPPQHWERDDVAKHVRVWVYHYVWFQDILDKVRFCQNFNF